MKWCAQTFLPIFWIFTIFDRNLAKIVAPPSNECENYVAFLKVQSLPKKTLQTSSKSAYKRKPNAFRTMHPSNARCSGLGAWQKKTNKKTKKETPHLRTYSRRALCDLPQTLHGDRARRVHQKGVIHFSIQRIVFPTGCTEKFGLIYRCAVSPQ